MKKLLALITTLLIATVLVGCNGQTEVNDPVMEEDTATTKTTDVTEKDIESDSTVTDPVILSGEENPLEEKDLLEDILSDLDLNKCNSLDSSVSKQVCINNISTELALQNADVTYCNKIDSKAAKDKCILKVQSKGTLEEVEIIMD